MRQQDGADSLNEGFRAGLSSAKKGNKSHEGSGIGKEDLREVQSHYAPRCGACDLRKRKAQAASGVRLNLAGMGTSTEKGT
jgi:hypothetical protein